MGGRLLPSLLLLLLLLVFSPLVHSGAATNAPLTSSTPAPVPFAIVDNARCMNCDLPPTFTECGNDLLPNCRRPFSMPYKGQNHKSTCARLRCPEYFDLFVNTLSSSRYGNTILEYEARRPVLNPQTAICSKFGDIDYRFMIRDGAGLMRPVTDAHCKQNNYPRHSCVSDGFVKQECTNNAHCTPIRYLSDYGGNKCESPYKLHMRFNKEVEWEPLSKITCDRDLGWWRLHFPNGTWMHTRYGTIATCVAITFPDDPSKRVMPTIVKTVLAGLLIISTLAVSFNAYMTRSVVVWAGSDWHKAIALASKTKKEDRDEKERDQIIERTARDEKQDQIVGYLNDNKWMEICKDGLTMDLRQFDIMQNADRDEHMSEMLPWTMVDDFDYNTLREESEA